MRLRNSGETVSGLFMARETVAVETPAFAATWRSPTRFFERPVPRARAAKGSAVRNPRFCGSTMRVTIGPRKHGLAQPELQLIAAAGNGRGGACRDESGVGRAAAAHGEQGIRADSLDQ